MYLSAHFTLEELIATQHREIDNTPSQDIINNLQLLARGVLEDCRFALGPMHINSGYRSPELNAAVGGQPTSQHCEGLAADFIAPRYSLQECVRRILDAQVQFDQLIYEFGSWIHVSHPALGKLARREQLMIGPWTGGKYQQLNLADCPK